VVSRRLGRYHLVEPIGGGPTGEVHRARVYGVAGFERQFAVKKFHPEVVANPNVAAKLSAAARAYGGLEHPRIARLFEYGVAGGDTFTACELVPGLDLAQLLAASNQALPAGAAFSLIASAARAVGYAHGRGILHLGLAPTNLIATPDGDLKVTDVGILAPRLPSRPSDDPQLMWRLAYLAPEQLVGESTSAATDVFAFGVIAFELVTGQRAFLGATALDVEQAILSAQPREPALPKPLLRVLQRCWARSPFERFPDARALADAVDAALRLAPVPGGKREIAALVRDALDRIEQVREQQLSGALNLPMMPSSPPPSKRPPSAPIERIVVPPAGEPPPRPSQTIARITPVPATRASGPIVTPIPTPARPITRTSKPSRSPSADTTDEVTIARSPLDQALSTLGHDGDAVTPPPVSLSAVVSRAPGDRSPVPSTPRAVSEGYDSSPTVVRDSAALVAKTLPEEDKATIKMPPLDLSRALTFSEALDPEIVVERGGDRADTSGVTIVPSRSSDPSIEMVLDSGDMDAVDPGGVAAGSPPPTPMQLRSASPTINLPPTNPPSFPPPRKTPSALGQVDAPEIAAEPRARGRVSNRTVWALLGVVMAGGAAVAGVMAWQQWGAAKTTPVKSGSGSAKQIVVAKASIDAGAPRDAITGTGTGTGTSTATGADAGVPVAPPDKNAGGPDTVTIISTPPGASVFLDGAEQGKTPLTIPTARDKHTIVVVKDGFDLFTQDVDARGEVRATLKESTPTGGPAGIKVKCVHKDRYYVIVDGAGTGQLCPTERIHVSLGPHTVEVYDLVTEQRTQYPVVVKDTEHSLRVKLD
jgi:serine/threonine protein kinase